MSDTCDVCEEPAVQWNRDTFDGPVKRACRRHTETPENILQDLIAELRVMGGEYDSGWAPLIPVADRAEQRLREVQGE